MSTKRTPVQVVRDEHEGKEKLVEKIMGIIERSEENAEEIKGRLLKASNRQLLRLAKSAEVIRSKYGSKDQLVATVASALGRAKDSDFAKRLSGYTPRRLLDMAQSLIKRKSATAPRTAKAETAKSTATPKAKTAAKPRTKTASKS